MNTPDPDSNAELLTVEEFLGRGFKPHEVAVFALRAEQLALAAGAPETRKDSPRLGSVPSYTRGLLQHIFNEIVPPCEIPDAWPRQWTRRYHRPRHPQAA